MFKGAGTLMTCGTLPCVAVSEVYRMLEGAVGRTDRLASKHLVYGSVADCTVVPYYLALIAEVLAIVASETTLRVQMPKVIWRRAIVGLHLWKEISLVDALDLGDSTANGCFF